MSEGQLPIFYADREMFSMCMTDREKRLKLKNRSGVYVIFSFKYGFVYIGKAADMYERIIYHTSQKTDRTIIKVLLRNAEGEVISNYAVPRQSKTLLDKIREDKQFSLGDLYNSQLIFFPVDNTIERRKFEKELIKENSPRYNITYK